MNALDNVTVSFVIRESWWKQNGTTFGRLRITFKRDSRFIKTNILLHREDIGKTGKSRIRTYVASRKIWSGPLRRHLPNWTPILCRT